MEEGIHHDNADSLSYGEALQRPTAGPFSSVLIGILRRYLGSARLDLPRLPALQSRINHQSTPASRNPKPPKFGK